MSDIIIGVESVVTEIVITVESGGEGVTIHNELTERDAAGCHPASAIEYGDGSVEEILMQLLAAKAITGEPTGFTNPGGIIRTYDKLNRTITLTGDVEAYYNGVLIPELVSGWVSDPHDESPLETLFLYHDGTNFVWSTSPWDFDNLMIASVPVYGSDIFGLSETHGLMQWQAHKEFHDTVGTYRDGGGDLSGHVLNSTVAANRRPDISALTVRDEDLPTVLAALVSKLYTQVYFSGAGTVNFVKSAADIVPLSGANPYYNLFSGGVWSQALVSNNNYMSVWLVAFPTTSDNDSKEYRFQWLQGQSQGTLASQQALSPQSLSLGAYATFAPEFVFIARVIIRYTAANWVISQVDNLFVTRASTVASPAGNFLTGVTTDETLEGNGTPSNPLGIPEITDIPTNEMDDSLVLSPNGLGGVEWRAEAGGGVGGEVLIDYTLTADASAIDFTVDKNGNPLNFVDGDEFDMYVEIPGFGINKAARVQYRFNNSSDAIYITGNASVLSTTFWNMSGAYWTNAGGFRCKIINGKIACSAYCAAMSNTTTGAIQQSTAIGVIQSIVPITSINITLSAPTLPMNVGSRFILIKR